ncbi:MAG: 3-oxoacyl-[acyl-carrier-protein] synthase III C-terminal domain-containing protein, partial [Dehalococcoidia bacterium]
ARHFLRIGTYRRVMILNCEFNFEEYIRWDFRSVEDLSFLWPGFSVGEAATATILEQGSNPDDYYAVFKNWGSQHQLCQIPLHNASEYAPDGDFRANPPLRFFARALELSRFATTQLEGFYLADERLSGAVHDIVFGHSTSVPDVRRVLKRLSIEPSAYIDIFPRYGNTVSASVPLAISLASQDGRLDRGQRVLLLVPSAGVSIGLCQFTY